MPLEDLPLKSTGPSFQSSVEPLEGVEASYSADSAASVEPVDPAVFVPPTQARESWEATFLKGGSPWAWAGFAAVLMVLSVLYRGPALSNASATHSDAAVVGLQAMHILRGEHGVFLWGSGYQTAVDSYGAALAFRVLGTSPLTLMVSTLAEQMLLTFLEFATLAPACGSPAAFVLTLPLVFTSAPVHTYVLYPPRQASLTLAVASAVLLHRAPWGRSLWRWALGAGLGALAVFADPYALVFVPGLVALTWSAAWDGVALPGLSPRALVRNGGEGLRRLGAAVGGAVLGSLPLAVLWAQPAAQSGPRSLRLDLWRPNGELLLSTALPWMAGAKMFAGSTLLDFGPWVAPGVVRGVGALGAMAWVVLMGLGAHALSKGRSEARRQDSRRQDSRRRGGLMEPRSSEHVDPREHLDHVGLFAFVTLACTLGGFLVSPMVMDLFSARYLAAMVLVLPFLAGFLATRGSVSGVSGRCAKPWVLGLSLAIALASGLGGWVAFGPFVRGASLQRTPDGQGDDVAQVSSALQKRGIVYAVADYWVSYRFTFVAQEATLVVPLHEREDRYRPYREGFQQATRFAYLHDATRSRESYEEGRAMAERWGRRVDEWQNGALRVALFEKR